MEGCPSYALVTETVNINWEAYRNNLMLPDVWAYVQVGGHMCKLAVLHVRVDMTYCHGAAYISSGRQK
jgi:hypothetical protein